MHLIHAKMVEAAVKIVEEIIIAPVLLVTQDLSVKPKLASIRYAKIIRARIMAPVKCHLIRIDWSVNVCLVLLVYDARPISTIVNLNHV